MQKTHPDKRTVLSEAFENTVKAMGLRGKEVEAILGVSKEQVRRLKSSGIDPESNSGQLCLLLIRIYRSLSSLLGGNKEQLRHWLTTQNRAFGGVAPLQKMQSIEGLVQVLNYCDAHRGNI